MSEYWLIPAFVAGYVVGWLVTCYHFYKKYMLVLLLLALPAVGWGGEITMECKNDGTLCQCVVGAARTQVACSPSVQSGSYVYTFKTEEVDCLAMMEAAMRESEPYIFEGKDFSYPWIMPYETPAHPQERKGYQIVQDSLEEQMWERRDKLKYLWDTTKRECWRQT